MAFDDGTQTGVTRPLGVSTGEFQAVRPTFEAVPALVAGSGSDAGQTTGGAAATAPVPNLHYVFDDPNDGEPGRDRVLVHGVWELVLALAIAGVGIALTQARPGALAGDQLRDLLLAATVIGLLGIASAVSLRAAVPNLAVGGAAVFAALWVAENADGQWLGPAAVAVGICAAIGLAQGLVVAGLHVPAWAVSLAVLLCFGAWAAAQSPGAVDIDYTARPDAYLWFAVVSAVSVIGSLFGLSPSLRRGFARFRPVADPARRRSVAAAVIAVVATVVSMVIAAVGGVLIVLIDGAPDAAGAAVELTALGLGAALLGGTSAFGRRGGIFGTIFAACLLALVVAWLVEVHPQVTTTAWVSAGAIGVGLAVTRLVERFGRPVLLPPVEEEESWMPRVHSLAPTSKPWQPAPTPTGGLWSSDEGWGAPPQ
ncbi:MAG: ABC transporter permease [Micromonosporaceae bacterium]|nr:ABC transporter permease [Micromonosporaceae bacterium]